jgi:hypothetical protein
VCMYVAHVYICACFVVPALSRGAKIRAMFYFAGNLYECQCFGETLIFCFIKFLALIYVPFIGEVMLNFSILYYYLIL